MTQPTLDEQRIATQCVCCKSANLEKSPAVLMPFIAHRIFEWIPVEITDEWGLKSIRNGMAYSVCNSVLCRSCGHLFLDMRFTDAELDRLYAGYRGTEYTSLREQYEPGYTRRNEHLNSTINYLGAIEEFLRPYVKLPAAILDWGGDTGKNTPFRGRSSLIHIYDISNKDVAPGAVKVDRDAILSTRYDLVVSMNVLEHIPFPARLVGEIVSAMGSETILYVEVPFEELVKTSATRSGIHRLKKHWHEHINFYNEVSLRRMLERSGLEVVALRDLDVTVGEVRGCVFQVACRRSRHI